MSKDEKSKDEKQKDKRASRLGLAFLLIVLIATVFTSYVVWQATLYSSKSGGFDSEANALRTLSNRYYGAGMLQEVGDAILWTDWCTAIADNNTQLAAFLEARFRDEFKPAFYAWLNSTNGTGGIPLGTPFTLPEYQLEMVEEGKQLDQQIENLTVQSDIASNLAKRLVLVTLLMATVIFLASLESRIQSSIRLKYLVLAVTIAIFILALIIVIPIPPIWTF
jgi:hypothetical protein